MQNQPQTTQQAQAGIKAIRLTRVLDKTGLSRSQLYRLVAAGKFPPPAHLSERITVWKELDVDQWLAAKFAGHDC